MIMNVDHTYMSVIKAATLPSILEVVYTHPIDVIKTHQQNKVSFSVNMSLLKGIVPRTIGIIPIRTSFWSGLHISRTLHIKDSLCKALFVSTLQTLIDTPIENMKIAHI